MPFGNPCRAHRCPRLQIKGSAYCAEHQSEQKKAFSGKRKERLLFYGTKRWKAVRAAKLAEDPLCNRCPRGAEVVHHIKCARENPDLRFEWDNLESLCHSCHNRESQKEATEARLQRKGFG